MARRVKFGSYAEHKNNKSITVEAIDDSTLKVNLGMLKCYSRYCVEVNVGLAKDFSGQDEILIELTEGIIAGPHFVRNEPDGCTVGVEIATSENELEAESVVLRRHSSNIGLTLIFVATVLGPDQGTPLLRDGIHCIGKRDPD